MKTVSKVPLVIYVPALLFVKVITSISLYAPHFRMTRQCAIYTATVEILFAFQVSKNTRTCNSCMY